MNINEKAENAIRICMACDDKYAMHCAAAVASMIDNHKSGEKLEFFILNREISPKSKKRLEKAGNTKNSSLKIINVDPKEFEGCPVPENMHFTLETYFRLKLPDFFPDFDKILYIDVDVTVLGDIKELWDFDVDGVFAGVCEDITRAGHLSCFIKDFQNFNAGVMVINLKKWREENISRKCFDFIEQHSEKIIWVDQDVLNSVLIPVVRYFERCWNLEYTPDYDVVSGLYPENEIKLIHHITRNKPWNSVKEHVYAEKYFKYLSKTPWRHHKLILKTKIVLKRLFRAIYLFRQNLICKKQLENAIKGKRAVLWGASLFIQKIIEKFGLNSDNIVGIIDRDVEKRGKTTGKYKIYGPQDLQELNPDFIVSAVLFQPKMREYIQAELDKNGLNIEICDDLFSKIEDY